MLTKTIAATTYPVTLAQASNYVRAPDNGDDDARVQRALDGAIEYVERAISLTAAPATFEYRATDWPCAVDGVDGIDLPMGPVRDVTSVEYYDENDDLQAIASSNYQWSRTDEGARIRFASDYTLPDLTEEQDFRVVVTFEAGFDDPATSGSGDSAALRLPATLPIAILMLADRYYENGHIDPSDPGVMAANAILAQIKVYR